MYKKTYTQTYTHTHARAYIHSYIYAHELTYIHLYQCARAHQLAVCNEYRYQTYASESFSHNTSVQCTLFCGISMESNNRSILSL